MTDTLWATQYNSPHVIGHCIDDDVGLHVFCLYCVNKDHWKTRLLPLYNDPGINATLPVKRTMLAAKNCELCNVPLLYATLFHLAQSGDYISVCWRDGIGSSGLTYRIKLVQRYGLYFASFYENATQLPGYWRPVEDYQHILMTRAQLLEWCAENRWVRDTQ